MAFCLQCGSPNTSAPVGSSQQNANLLDPSHDLYLPLKYLSEVFLYGNQATNGSHHGPIASLNINGVIFDPRFQQSITPEWVLTLTQTLRANNVDPRQFSVLVRMDISGFKCETYYKEKLILLVRREGVESALRLLTLNDTWKSEIEKDVILGKLSFDGEGGLVVMSG